MICEPLHELVINYKMELDVIANSTDSPMTKLCLHINLSFNYGAVLKSSDEITLNDASVFGALTLRAFNNV
ncbi:hypothetical protein [methanotrophic endosymbiont of Bathymodiolus puteoserpentis (Logatchev)]|jgi:hypothetical protein|uniref:hypothetical protein n=1 Tax=methanotrophic endosymbiont of Bathymodiolus puteoserpentis (Logatchev) TaxID=343235 RepID=UPI0013C80586|nr:hypothetical protein [methanotrophic endosymbiont of Bathymodiolus puteoserpentis (Logatchev)]SHE22629.1 hypothetical protein BPUTEOMOX_2334 [methanotrophic endosymbiont of Bathymodiolus puteoserpentis (Logatchev)]